MTSNRLGHVRKRRKSPEESVFQEPITILQARQKILSKYLDESEKCAKPCCSSAYGKLNCFLLSFIDEKSMKVDENAASNFLLEVRNRRALKTESEYNRYVVTTVVNTIISDTNSTNRRLDHCWAVEACGRELLLCRKEWAWVIGISINATKRVVKEWRIHKPGEEVNIDKSYVFSDRTYHALSYEEATDVFQQNGLPVGNRLIFIYFLIYTRL